MTVHENIASIVSLAPRDGLFLKDGRGWFTSESGRAGVVEWPFASTVRGALRTCLGQADEERSGKLLDPSGWQLLNESLSVAAVLPLCRGVGELWSASARRWPAPRDAVMFIGESQIQPLTPRSADIAATTIPLATDPETAAIEALRHPAPGDAVGKAETMPKWWNDEAFTAWLCGMNVQAATVSAGEQPATRVQTHVSINTVTAAAIEGGLFSSSVLEPLSRSAGGPTHEWAVAAIGSGFDALAAAGRRVRLGGDGRMSTCETVPADVFAIPEQLRKVFVAGSRGLRLLLVGHASFENGWRPKWLKAHNGQFAGDLPGVGRVVLRAACVGRPVHVSGWDMALGKPKPTRRLAPAGSVYFFEKADEAAFTDDDAEALWLRPIGEAAVEGEATGAVVPGVWRPA